MLKHPELFRRHRDASDRLHMLRHMISAVRKALELQLVQQLLLQLLFRERSCALYKWFLDLIIIYAGRNHFFVRVQALLQLHDRIQIDHQLQLQSIIDRTKLQRPATGFIINDLHIDAVIVLIKIHTVDHAAQIHPLLFT